MMNYKGNIRRIFTFSAFLVLMVYGYIQSTMLVQQTVQGSLTRFLMETTNAAATTYSSSASEDNYYAEPSSSDLLVVDNEEEEQDIATEQQRSSSVDEDNEAMNNNQEDEEEEEEEEEPNSSTPVIIEDTTEEEDNQAVTTRTTATSSLRGNAKLTAVQPQQDKSRDLPPRLQLMEEWNHFKIHWRQNKRVLNQKYNNKLLPDFIKGHYTSSGGRDVVLATHTSIDKEKLDRVDILQRYWQGPISIALRVRSKLEIDRFFDYFEELPSAITSKWTIHFLLENPKALGKSDSFASQYCHNALRNLALHSHAIPDFVLSVDLDFVPTYGGYPKLMTIMKQHPTLWDKLQNDKQLLVVPVMEVLHIPAKWEMNSTTLVDALSKIDGKDSYKKWTKSEHQLVKDLKNLQIYERGIESDLPKSRQDLRLLYKYKAARQWHHIPGHAPTDLNKYWKYNPETDANANATYPITPTYKYEPYFIGYKPQLPRFWEGFRGYGLNKQAWVRECILAGFTMEALYQLYLTHLAHPSNNNQNIKAVNAGEWDNEFQYHLEKHYSKPDWDKGDGKWWYADPTWRHDRPKYVTTRRMKQYS